MIDLAATFFLLCFAHFVFDFPLQGDYVAKYKNPCQPRVRIVDPPWGLIMFAHATMHAGGVYLVTGIIQFAMAELLLHFWIDYQKCHSKFTYVQDQALHILCKLFYVVILWITVGSS